MSVASRFATGPNGPMTMSPTQTRMLESIAVPIPYTEPLVEPTPFQTSRLVSMSVPVAPQPSQTVSSFSANLETFTSIGDSYFQLAADAQEVADWSRFPAVSIVEMDGFGIRGASQITTVGMNVNGRLAVGTLGASVNGPVTILGTGGLGVSQRTTTQDLTVNSGTITLVDASGSQILQGIGTDLFYDGQLIAKANDIQNISDWALYPANGDVNLDLNSLNLVRQITDVSGGFGAVGQVLSSTGSQIAWTTPSAGNAVAWATFPAVQNVDVSGQSLNRVAQLTDVSGGFGTAGQVLSSDGSKIVWTTPVVPPSGVTTLNTQSGAIDISSANANLTVDASVPGTILLTAIAAPGGVPSVNGETGPITITTDPATVTVTPGPAGTFTFAAPTLGVSTDLTTTAFGVANSASLSASAASLAAGGAATAAASAQATADSALIAAGAAQATASTALAQSGVTTVNSGTFAVTIAAGTGIGVATTYGSGVQDPTITISATGGGSSVPFSYNLYVSNISGSDVSGTGLISNPYQTIGRALTVANGISDSNKVSIVLAAGTYTENVSVTRANTFISGGAPNLSTATNIVGSVTVDMTSSSQPLINGGIASVQVSNIVYNNSVARNQSYLISDCLIAPGPGVSAIVASDISPGGNGDITVQNSLIYVSNVIGVSTSNVYIAFVTVEIKNNPAIIAPVSFIQTTAAGRVLLLNCSLTQDSTSPSVAPIINLANTATTAFMTVSNSGIRYSSAVSDAGSGGKCCIRFANSGTIASLILYNNLLVCEGATTTTGIPGQFLVLQKTGAGTATLNYGQNSAGTTAHHLPPASGTFIKVPYVNVV